MVLARVLYYALTLRYTQLFIKDNQGGSETTVVNHIGLFGSPLDTTNMSDFKRVAGEKGEKHQ